MIHQSVQLSGFVAQYLCLTTRRRKIFQFLRWYNSRFPLSFPTMNRISKWTGLSERAIQKFFEKLRKEGILKNYLTINLRKNKWGGDSSNLYILNKDFKLALDWLSIHSYLNAPKSKSKRIISSMEKQEKVHPPSPQKFTPLSITPLISNSHTFTKNVWINPAIKNLKGIDMGAKIYASRYASEFEIQDALEACKYHEKRTKILNPSSYFMGTLKNKIKKRCEK